MPTKLNVKSKLKQLGATPLADRLKPSKKLTQQFVGEFAPNLPKDYQSFLDGNAGIALAATCPFAEPTPYGDEARIVELFGFMPTDNGSDLRINTELGDAAPVAVPIGADETGNWIYLMCEGPLAGTVLFQDQQGRSQWSDKRFEKELQKLPADIKSYLKKRREGELTEKAEALQDFYRLAETFTAFLSGCHPKS